MRRNGDELLRDLERRAAAGDADAAIRLRHELRRRGKRYHSWAVPRLSRDAIRLPIYVPEEWVARLGVHFDGFEGTVDTWQTSWGDERIFVDLFQGEEEVYLRVERHLEARVPDEDPDTGSDVYVYGRVRDGQRVTLPALTYDGVLIAGPREAVLRILRTE